MKLLTKLFGKKTNIEVKKVDVVDKPAIGVHRQVNLIPYFVYSNSENKMIGSIYLTEDQSYQLNKLMQYKGIQNQDIAFLMQ